MLKLKKIIAALIACAASVSIVATNASAYNLHYAHGAPSRDNVLTTSDATTSTGKGYITVNSTTFYTSISGAYVSAKGSTHSTSPLAINTEAAYTLNYSGTTAPKDGVRVVVNFTLENYTVSEVVSAIGTISA